jgi:DNA-binding transcriptional LysR family regulator
MDLNETNVFVKVVDAGSFARAAHRLEMPKSTVSAKVSALERRLGVTLIQRTTRRLHVTDTGQEYYQQCVQALQQITSAEEHVTRRQSVPQGSLRITAPIQSGISLLLGVFSEFQNQYPEVNLEIILTERNVDLVSEGVDLALRAGELEDSSLISRKLGTLHFALFASPKYLKTNGMPKSPRDLKDHCSLQFTPRGHRDWKLSGPKGTQTIPIARHMLINDLNLIKVLAVSGAGVALLPTFFCSAETESGKLVRILNDWKSNAQPVHFVYPNQEFIPKKLTAFLDVATRIIQKRLET